MLTHSCQIIPPITSKIHPLYNNHDGTTMDMGVSELTDAELMKMGQDVEYLLSLNMEEFNRLNVVQ